MIRCHCHAPAIYRGRCLFHQSPDGVRPDIDSYTGNVRRDKEAQKAHDKAVAKAARQPKVKVKRTPVPRPTVTVPVESIRADYLLGASRNELRLKYGIGHGRLAKALEGVPVRHGRQPVPFDPDEAERMYLEGKAAREVAALHVRESRVLGVLNERGVVRPNPRQGAA